MKYEIKLKIAKFLCKLFGHPFTERAIERDFVTGEVSLCKCKLCRGDEE